MHQMTREEFGSRAATSIIVPIFRELLADELTPVSAYRTLAQDESHSFLLESVEHGERWSRYSFIGIRPLGLLESRDGQTLFESQDPTLGELTKSTSSKGFLDTLEALMVLLATNAHPDLPPLQSGFVGFIGYDVVREIEELSLPNVDPVGFGDALMVLIGDIACFDHLAQRLFLISTAVVPSDASEDSLDDIFDAASNRLDELEARLRKVSVEPLVVSMDSTDVDLANLVTSISSESFCSAVEVAREYILSGDIFQVVLSKRFSFDLGCDPLSFYRVLRLKNPSPYMYFLDFPEIKIAGSSPEPLVKVEGERVISRPIAGTRPRGQNETEDRFFASELREHPKELAEHIMLVDLARNDLGRISKFGSEVIDEMMTLEKYSRVMHLTSQISSIRREDVSLVDVLRATMPAGTVSGAPKVRAMQIIDDLEPVKRGPYAGVVGYFDLAGNMDVAIAIRTVFIEPSMRAHLQAGAGIVYDSDPISEDLECDNKARALLEAATIASQSSKAATIGSR